MLDKHMRVAHPAEYQSWDPSYMDEEGDYENNRGKNFFGILKSLHIFSERVRRGRYKHNYPEEIEPPPALEAVMPGDSEVCLSENDFFC